MSHNQEPYRLKAPTRKDIEEQIPFELYSEDEEGNEVEHFADERFSYKFLDWEWMVEPEYDDNDEIINSPKRSSYVLADLNVYIDKEIEFSDPVEVLNVETPKHGWQ